MAVERSRSPEVQKSRSGKYTSPKGNASKAETQTAGLERTYEDSSRVESGTIISVRNVLTPNLECLSETRTALIVCNFLLNLKADGC